MRERGLEFKVGLLIVFAVIIMVGFIFLLGNFSLSSGYTIFVDYNFTGNLQTGAPVKVSGIKVGKIEEVHFHGGKIDEATNRRVQVRLEVWLEDRVRDSIRSNAEFFINTAGVLGEQYLEIVPGDNYEEPPVPAGAIVRGVDPPRTDLIVARLYEVLDSFSTLLRDERDLIKNLLKNTSEAVHEANVLLRDNRDTIGELLTSSNSLAGEATTTLNKVNQGLGDPRVIARTIRDADTLIATANNSLTELTPPAKEFVRDANRVTSLVTDERVAKLEKVANNAITVTERGASLATNINGLVTDIRGGKGTAGALISRDELYADLREMIRDLKRNPWKFFWKE